MKEIAAALAVLIDKHLNGRPGALATIEEWQRHCRIGDKLLELLVETVEVEDTEFFIAIKENLDLPAKEPIVPESHPPESDVRDINLKRITFNIVDSPDERRSMRERLRSFPIRSKERDWIYRDALDMTAVDGKWWIAEAARALGVNINTMQQAVKRIDPEHPRLYKRPHR